MSGQRAGISAQRAVVSIRRVAMSMRGAVVSVRRVAMGMRETGPRRIAVSGPLALCAAVAVLLCACAPALAFAPTPSGFGFQSFDGLSLSGSGAAEMQAGAHPRELSFTFALNAALGVHGETLDSAGGELRDLVLGLPAGLVLNAVAVPQCTRKALDEAGACAGEYQVGEVALEVVSGGGVVTETSPVYNMAAPAGVPGELAFRVDGVDVLAYESVRTASDGGIDLSILDLPPEKVVGGRIVLFGVMPGGAPFLTLPTVCAGPVPFTLRADTWQQEGAFAEASFLSHETLAEGGGQVGIEGCDHLGFGPTVSISAETKDADTATGLTVDVRSPQGGLLVAGDLGTSDIEGAQVLLPEGLVLDPNRAEGLVSCPPAEDGVGSEGPPSCPATSQVGTVQITTPILPDTIEGGVYALPSSPPDLKLLFSGSADGVYLKLTGELTLNQATGQVTLSLPQAPLLPLSDLRVSLSGGGQGALVTPAACGVYTASSDLTPWVAPAVGDALETSSIAIAAGPGGGPCVTPPPFTPTLTAGSSNDGAGNFTSFSMLIERPEGQQRLSSFQLKAPPGLLGMIGSVPVCGEPQAAQGVCPESAQVGHAVIGAGPGGYPLFLPGAGQPPIPVYLTGPYEGAPYGLAIVVPFLAGPYDLGTVVLRARIEVDPHTLQLTIASDALPAILDGVPLDLRTLYAVLDRPGFMFNPTDCDHSSFQGSASSVEGATVPLSSSFQVGSCQSLKFAPTLTLAAQAKTSKQQGASLTARIAYPESQQGTVLATAQANLQSVKLQLPKQLPSRSATLARACPAAVFEANPAGCPAASLVGRASLLTPVLTAPLSGPSYLVSRAGEAHPSLSIVLQGGGLTLDLDATTAIAKSAITTTTFSALPDIPISSFELTLPEGPNSALAADGSLCKSALKTPTEMVAQNGAVISQSTMLAVTGCPKTAKHKHAAKHKHKHAKRKAKRRRSK